MLSYFDPNNSEGLIIFWENLMITGSFSPSRMLEHKSAIQCGSGRIFLSEPDIYLAVILPFYVRYRTEMTLF